MIEGTAWDGVQSLLDNYIRLRDGDYVLLLYTTDSSEVAAWVCAALELRDVPTRRVWMAPLRDEGFLKRLTLALPESPSSVDRRLVVLTLERDTMSHTRTLAAAVARFQPHCAIFRAISASTSLFADALRETPEQLSARNAAILDRLMTAQRLHITTPSGSDLHVGIKRQHRWISNRGVARQGGVVILPAGEVATYPASIAGVFVADFAFNINAITTRDSRLSGYPVTVRVEEGRATGFDCDDSEMRSFLSDCFQTYCAFNVGELGFGTNGKVVDAIPLNSHINERTPGVHLGFGQHNQDPGVVPYQCSIHLDLIAKGGKIWVDDDPRPLDLENIVPSFGDHPMSTRDEDVFSPEALELEVDDCCGILDRDGLQLFSACGSP